MRPRRRGQSELIAFGVFTGARRSVARGTFGASLLGFRVDGSAAYAAGATGELLVVDVRSGTGASIPISGHFGEAVRLN